MAYTYTDTDAAIINRGLQSIGTRTTVTAAEMNGLTSNEAIQMNLIYQSYRDQLLRMAQWDCATKYDNLIWLTSMPGTPENTSTATNTWQPGQPPPPFAYEYFYPADCLRACFIIPAQQTGFSDGIPITTAITGGAPAFWQGQPMRFKIVTDEFRAASGLTIVAGGSGYQVNDTVVFGTDTLNMDFNSTAVPAGIVNVSVTSVDGSGAITGASLTAFGGTQVSQNALLYKVPSYTLVQVQTSGLGTGATATVSGVGQTKFSARTLVTNQEFATLAYIKQVTDPTVFDPQFVEAFAYALGSGVCMALIGDKTLANRCVEVVNQKIEEARKTDGNEGLTMNDVTPDFIRIRGVAWFGTELTGPYAGFNWGDPWPAY